MYYYRWNKQQMHCLTSSSQQKNKVIPLCCFVLCICVYICNIYSINSRLWSTNKSKKDPYIDVDIYEKNKARARALSLIWFHPNVCHLVCYYWFYENGRKKNSHRVCGDMKFSYNIHMVGLIRVRMTW